jgi:hypothetical protein
MGYMSKVELSEEEIDRIVIAQANDDSAWDEPIQVGRPKAGQSMSNSVRVDQRILGRLEELITTGEQVLRTKTPPHPNLIADDSLDEQSFIQWETSCLSLLGRVSGKDSIHYQTFNSLVGETADYAPALKGLGVLKAAKDDYEHGYLFETRVLIEAEVFGDLLEQAEHLLTNGYYGAAAVLTGGVLEDGLRKLCQRKNVSLPSNAMLDPMNVQLAKAGVYNELTQEKITAIAHIRNKSAHGQWDELSVNDVKQMIDQVRRFMEEFFS